MRGPALTSQIPSWGTCFAVRQSEHVYTSLDYLKCSLSRKSTVVPNNLKTSPKRFWPYMHRGTRTCLFCLSKNQSRIAFRKDQSCIGHWWCAKHSTRADANNDGNSQSPGNGLMFLSCPPVPLSTADTPITALPPKYILSPFIFLKSLFLPPCSCQVIKPLCDIVPHLENWVSSAS